MHNNSEGSNPSLRAQLGVGWNRPLPSAFEFANGVLPDGVNDFLIPIAMEGGAGPTEFLTISGWMKRVGTIPNNTSHVLFSNRTSTPAAGLAFNFDFTSGSPGNPILGLVDSANVYRAKSAPLGSTALNQKHYFVVIFDLINFSATCYWDGSASSSSANFAAGSFSFTAGPLKSFSMFTNRGGFGIASNVMYDELIIWNRKLSAVEIKTNYNAGFGGNAQDSEGSLAWWKMDIAEADTILNPGGNPVGWPSGAWGIRDIVNNYHAQQENFAANNETLGGALQSF